MEIMQIHVMTTHALSTETSAVATHQRSTFVLVPGPLNRAGFFCWDSMNALLKKTLRYYFLRWSRLFSK